MTILSLAGKPAQTPHSGVNAGRRVCTSPETVCDLVCEKCPFYQMDNPRPPRDDTGGCYCPRCNTYNSPLYPAETCFYCGIVLPPAPDEPEPAKSPRKRITDVYFHTVMGSNRLFVNLYNYERSRCFNPTKTSFNRLIKVMERQGGWLYRPHLSGITIGWTAFRCLGVDND
jgi:hypothetical protein